MNTFKRKALTCAVLAGLGAAGSAEAVYRNPDQVGEVLIFPYYTVNSVRGNAYNTYLSITNTTSRAKVLKVRFREGRASAEVLDFNLYLSPNDVWVAAVAPPVNADGTFNTSGDAPATIYRSNDLSCTHPTIPTAGEPFKNFDYLVGTGRNLPGTGLDRTREGYIEVFEMATLTGVAAANVTHTALDTPPPNCAAMQVSLNTVPAFSLEAPTGGLYGQGTLINVANGGNLTYKADALAAYANGAPYYADIGSANPLLGGPQVSTPPGGTGVVSNSLVMANNAAYYDTFAALSGVTQGARAVAATFMHSAVLNDYVLDTAVQGNTDWVLTFPGKNEFVTTASAGTPYTAVLTTAGACEPAAFTFFNRDEQSFIPGPGGFSPQGGGVAGAGTGNLCWESTVVSVRNGQSYQSAGDVSTSDQRSGVLGSRNVTTITVLPSFQNGWMSLTFSGVNATTTGLSSTSGTTLSGANGVAAASVHTFIGLPVTGFMVRNLANNAVTCVRGGATVVGGCSGNYSGLFTHSYRTTITP
jgi:hypothetical protein